MKHIEISDVVTNIANGTRPTICVQQYGRQWRASVKHKGLNRSVTKNDRHYSASFNDLVDVLDTGRGEYRVEFERKKDDFKQQ